MRAAEGGKEVVEGLFVRQIDHRESKTDLVLLRFEMKQVVIADAQIKQMTGQDARRIVVVVFGSGSGNFQKLRAILCGRAQISAESRANGRRRSGGYTAAE